MLEMVDSKAGDDRIELSKVGKRMIQIVIHDPDRGGAGETLAGRCNHCRREIEGNGFQRAAVLFDERQQASVASAQVKDAPRVRRNELQQASLALAAMQNGIRSPQIVVHVIGGCPEIDSHKTV